MSERRAAPTIVIGGGLAGIAAALALVDRGQPVTLLEHRPFLGGRVFSFRDPDSGAVIDNGQHVLVGTCTRLRAFLNRIGSRSAFRRQRRLRLAILDGGGRCGVLAAAPLPPPLHLAVALLGYRHLDLAAKRAVASAARRMVGARVTLDDDIPLGAWLAAQGMPDRAVQRFWEPLVRPALNARVADANLPLSAFFVERALWSGPGAAAMWVPTRGLSAAIGEPALVALRSAGVDVRLAVRAAMIEAVAGRVSGVVLADGSRLPAGRIVCAVPPAALDELATSLDTGTNHAAIGCSAIVNVYLWYDRPILSVPFAGTFDSPLQWLFDRTRLLGHEARGWCVGVSLSAADNVVGWPKDRLAEHCDEALARISTARRRARLVRHAVVKEPRATFRTGTAIAGRRPGPVTRIRGLFLAGDWTDTGWPATMEGAVLSGERAAMAALAIRKRATDSAPVP